MICQRVNIFIFLLSSRSVKLPPRHHLCKKIIFTNIRESHLICVLIRKLLFKKIIVPNT